MVRKIVDVKDPILRLRAKPVGPIDKKVLSLIQDMKETIAAQLDPEGVGLAAPQLGKSLQVFLIKYGRVEKVVINPQILGTYNNQQSKSRNNLMEGCLSLPHYYSAVKRPPKIKIKYKTSENKEVEEEFEGFYAQIVQHELDHLNGIIFVDRVLEQKTPLYKFNGKTFEEVEL